MYDKAEIREATSTAASIGPTTAEKHSLAQKDSTITRGIFYPVHSFKAFALALLASCAILIWLLAECVPTIEWKTVAPVATFDLVKYAVPAPAASTAPSGGVLEVFQVYQPIFTTPGASGETALEDGLDSVAPIAQTQGSGNCEVLLMEYSFGFSYGKPFIGKCKTPTDPDTL